MSARIRPIVRMDNVQIPMGLIPVHAMMDMKGTPALRVSLIHHVSRSSLKVVWV